jgi:hypothetical protein
MRVFKSKVTAHHTTHEWEVPDYPLHSSDIAPSDFHLFRPLKEHVTGAWFATDG